MAGGRKIFTRKLAPRELFNVDMSVAEFFPRSYEKTSGLFAIGKRAVHLIGRIAMTPQPVTYQDKLVFSRRG